jgi:hypothetical protein
MRFQGVFLEESEKETPIVPNFKEPVQKMGGLEEVFPRLQSFIIRICTEISFHLRRVAEYKLNSRDKE